MSRSRNATSTLRGYRQLQSRQRLHHATGLKEFAPAPSWHFDTLRQQLNVTIAREAVDAIGESLVIWIQAPNELQRHVVTEQLIKRFEFRRHDNPPGQLKRKSGGNDSRVVKLSVTSSTAQTSVCAEGH
jgi:hypothetical protein